jgi:PAS domain S-box-containing protein
MASRRSRGLYPLKESLRDSERQFRLLVAGVTDYAIYMLDTSGMITTWNTGAERIKGYSAEEVIGRHFSMFYTEEDRAAGMPERVLATAAREGRFEAEGRRVRKDGTIFWTNVVIDAIYDEEGSLIGFGKVTRDITERKEAEELVARAKEQMALSQKMEALGQLTGGIAHDFNNLLMIVGGQAQMLGKYVEDPRALRGLDAIRTAVTRGENLTRQLLAFSRKSALRSEVVTIGDRFARFHDMIASLLPGNIQLAIDIPPDIWNIELDVNELEFALINVVVNARDAMPRGGDLAIAARNVTLDGASGPPDLRGEFVAIHVTDTGTGIPAEIVPKIFDPFFTTKQVDKGTGLGLAQVYGFARQSKGAVAVKSEVGKGTTISFYFPRSHGKPANGDIASAEEKPAQASGTVLLVEDNVEVADVTATFLADLGYSVVHAPHSDAALGILKSRNDISLLLSDVVMPGTLNGIELAEKVRSENPLLPILLTTGYAKATEGVGKRFPILRKPYEIGNLDRAIRQAMR